MSARIRYTAFIAAAVVAAITAAAVAQQLPGQPARQIPPERQIQQPGNQQAAGAIVSAPGNQANNTDAQLAAWLIVDNQGEIAAAKIAQQRGDSEEVKNFAKQMLIDHSQFLEKLQRFAGPEALGGAGASPTNVRLQGAEGSGQAAAAAGNRDAVSNQLQPLTPGASGQTAQSGVATGVNRGLDIVDLKRRLGEKCMASLQRELEGKSGRDFDKCYAGQQLCAHMQVLDTLEVFKDFASPQLRNVLEEGITTTQGHLKHARQIVDDLDRRTAETAQSRSQTRQ